MHHEVNGTAGVTAGSPPLVGRDRELAALTTVVQRIASDGAALLLVGEPGVGKTALLDATAGLAAKKGVRVVRGCGVEDESDISYSGLHQLVEQLSAGLAHLPRSQRSAVEVALGFGAGPEPAPIVLMNAVLTVFSEAARDEPLLLVIDDLHVLDRASRSALCFVAARLRNRRVGLLGARRAEDGHGRPFGRSGFPELEVPPLSDAAALRLLSGHFAHLPRRVRETVARQAQGNPLALLEFGGSTSVSGGEALAAATGSGPGRDVRALYRARIERLPQQTRELLLLAALEGTGDMRVLEPASGAAGLAGLAAAERDHLVIASADGRAVRFRHPLVRAAVVEGATVEQRRAAHRRLADALLDQPERRAHHLSRAVVAPDAAVADLVAVAARSELLRGDAVGAAAGFERAAQLSPDGDVRRERLGMAAYVGARLAGHIPASRRLLEQARDESADAPATERSLSGAAAAGYLLLAAEGDASHAHRLLVETIKAASGDPEAFSAAVLTLLLTCHYSGRAEHWESLRAVVAALPHAPSDPPLSLVRILEGPGTVPGELLRDLDEQIDALRYQTAADEIIRTSMAALYLDRLAGCREPLMRVVHDARDGGAVGAGILALLLCACDDLHVGRWTAVEAATEEILVAAEDTELRLYGHGGHYLAALVAAHRGDLDVCAAHCAVLLDWGASRKLGRLEDWAHHALARAALGSSDFETAFHHAAAIATPGTLSPFRSAALWSALDLVEAALHSGRPEAARRHAAAMRDARADRISPRFALTTAAMNAMTSPARDMARRFDEALAVPDVERWPFEVARVELAYGERLRRQGLSREARVQLIAARSRFEQLGATPWTARAAAELRATGATRSSGRRAGATLTPQEREVARLAAAGLSNPEIAERLMLSPRTISTHLYRAFPKLGVTSRAALRDALAAAPEPGHEAPARGAGHGRRPAGARRTGSASSSDRTAEHRTHVAG